MKKRILFYAFAVFFLLSSCTKGKETTKETVTSKAEDTKTIEETSTNLDTSNDYLSYSLKKPSFDVPKRNSNDEFICQDLFNLGNYVTIHLDMEEEELEKLQEDYYDFKNTGIKGEIYRHCKIVTITIRNYDKEYTWTIEDVGIRQKGNTSRKNVFIDNKIAGLVHFKLSFDETFDDASYGIDRIDWTGKEKEYKERQERTFLGLSGLDLRANDEKDNSYIRETYSKYLFRASGLLNQYSGLSHFVIHQEANDLSFNMGVYSIYEPLTKSMIKRHLQDEKILNFGSWDTEKNGKYGVPNSKYGDLYKMLWGADLSFNSMVGELVGVENPSRGYAPTYDRKTNKEATYDDYLLKQAGLAISFGNYENIAGHVDLEYFAKSEAVSWILGDPDDLRNNMNNTMFYARRSDGKIVTIPIDSDRVFGLTSNWNPDGKGLTERDIFNRYRAGYNETLASPIYQKTILSSETNEAKLIYLNQIKAISISDWVKEETFDKYYQMAYKNYHNDVKTPFGEVCFDSSHDEFSNYTFKSYITKKLKLVDLSLNIGSPVKKEALELPKLEEFNGYYGDLYIAGPMNDWSGKQLKMTYEGNGIYTITFMPYQSGGIVYLKIYDGEYWRINWSIKNGNLLMYDTDAFCVSGLKRDSKVTITINTLTKKATIKKE